jgi:hypothetical protein
VLFNKTIKPKAQGQLGNDLFESRTMKSVMLDAMLLTMVGLNVKLYVEKYN